MIYLIDHKILNDLTIIKLREYTAQHSEPCDAENRTRYLVSIITRNCSIYRADPLTVTTVLVILINVITLTLGAADAVVLKRSHARTRTPNLWSVRKKKSEETRK